LPDVDNPLVSMEYGVASDNVLINGTSSPEQDFTRMCKDILEDKNIILDKMNNINLGNSGHSQMVTNIGPGSDMDSGHSLTSGGHPTSQIHTSGQRLPERVVEMYNMLIGITTELEKIKYELARRNKKSVHNGRPACDTSNRFSYENLHEQIILGNGVTFANGTEIVLPAAAELTHTEECNGKVSKPSKDMNLKLPEREDSCKKIKEDDLSPGPEGPLHPPSPFLIVANKFMGGPVILNVGGKRHEVRWNTLDKFPTSRLGRLRHCVTHRGLQQICDSYSLEQREYFFDRSPRNFDAILGLYRNGKLHLPAGVCVQDFCEELEYWGLDDLHMEPCCQHTYYRARWLLPQADDGEEKEEDFGTSSCASTQRHLWNLFENPHHSKAAKVVAIVSCLFVVVSTLCLIFSTLPAFQVKDEEGNISQEEYFFEVAEAVFVGWFSFEYVIRFVAAPQKVQFVKGAMNIIDLLGILPYFMSLLLSLITVSVMGSAGDGEAFGQYEMRRIAQIFRIMRILRIFKLARHITGLQTLGMTLRNSYKELGLLMLVVIMGMLIFSGLAYVGEKDEEGTMFDSMPTALYWAIITMTSVGYGDIYPVSWFGRLVASGCALCGVLCIALPIPIIVNNFNKFYEKSKIEEEIGLKKNQSSWEEAKREEMNENGIPDC